MKKIALKPFNNLVFYSNNVFRIDNGDNIFFNMDKTLKKKGIEIQTIDMYKDLDSVNLIISCDVPYPWDVKTLKKIFTHRKKTLLMCFESVLVNPFSSMSINKNMFRKVYTWDREKVDGVAYFPFFVPQVSYNIPKRVPDISDRKDLCMINSNKSVPLPFSLLARKTKNLYELRLGLLDVLESTKYRGKFDLYGRGWNTKLKSMGNGTNKHYERYKGVVANKLKTLSNYKFSVCYENSEKKGYVTEKIFDCFKVKTVPVYLGAPDVSTYIDSDSFVDRRRFDNDEQMLEFIMTMDLKRYKKYYLSGEQFLKTSLKDGKYFEKGFLDIIYENVR